MGSWIGSQIENKPLPFSFDENIWDLRHFYDKPYQKILDFQNINPDWYRQEAKKYSHYLLKSLADYSSSKIIRVLTILKQFGGVVIQLNLDNKTEISRATIIKFLDGCQTNKNKTINDKLSNLKMDKWLPELRRLANG